MIVNLQLCDVSDLEVATGLSHNELWDNGFNLDDCDCVLIVDESALPVSKVTDDFGYEHWRPSKDLYTLYYEDDISGTLYSILNEWEDYCVGSHYTKYNGKVYVSKHHA